MSIRLASDLNGLDILNLSKRQPRAEHLLQDWRGILTADRYRLAGRTESATLQNYQGLNTVAKAPEEHHGEWLGTDYAVDVCDCSINIRAFTQWHYANKHLWAR